MSSVTTFHMKPELLITKILHGLTLGLSLFCRIKISFTKTFKGVTLMPRNTKPSSGTIKLLNKYVNTKLLLTDDKKTYLCQQKL